MATSTIALLNPGEMGAAVGACLTGAGHRVLWAGAGRSADTRRRAEAARLEDAGTLERALRSAEVVLSICPPHGALDTARAVAAAGYRGLYVDCNAIAPATAREVGAIVDQAGAQFVDGGIIGPPPKPGTRCRLYLSGARAGEVAALFSGTALGAVPMAEGGNSASAIKMCYAAWSKGATALLADIRALATAEGIDASLTKEWGESQAGTEKRSEAVVGSARKAWRWISEMQEIAKSFESQGLPGGFHQAAAAVYTRLEGFKDHQPASLAEVVKALRR